MMQRYVLRGVFATLAAVALAICADAQAFTKPAFPRIAGIQIGAPFNYDDPGYQAALARQHVMILNYYPGLTPGGQTMNAIVQAIKARNPNALVFLYVHSDSLSYDPSGKSSAWDAYQSKLDSMKWWLYSDATLQQKVPSVFDSSAYTINNTLFTPKDANGDNAIDWMTKFFAANYQQANPAVDGLFMDNTFVKPNVDGDWSRSGIDTPQADPNAGAWLRQGYARYYSLAHRLMPEKYQIGNISEWGDSGVIPPEYQRIVNGGVMEAMIGKSWSAETYAGWQGMMTKYQAIMGALLEPKIAIFNQWGDPADYQAMRYGLGSCLLNDAYYSFTSSTDSYHGVVWFDELDVSLGAGSLPPSAPWQKGVWRRDFDNGIVLVNPKGNGAQTVTLETAYVKIQGTQDAVTNNGQTVTTVTLQDRDGLILMRKNPLRRPKAPGRITIGP